LFFRPLHLSPPLFSHLCLPTHLSFASFIEIPFSLEPHLDAIYRCFGKSNKEGTVKDIIANLDKVPLSIQ
jgi:hypothetical protein